MITLSLRDPTIYGAGATPVIEPQDSATIGAEFFGGIHEFIPVIDTGDDNEATHGAEFLQGNHFFARVDQEAEDAAAYGAAFLQGSYFFSLNAFTYPQERGLLGAAFQSGAHTLTLIIDPQFIGGQTPRDRGSLGVAFLTGTYAEIVEITREDEAATFGAEFLSGAYTMVNPGSGLTEDEFIVRFTTPNNSTTCTIVYASDDTGMPEALFTQPFTNVTNTLHRVTSYLGGVIEVSPVFVGGAIDQQYALIFTRVTPDDTVIPPGQFRGGATGDDADRSALGAEFFTGQHFFTLLFNASAEAATYGATFQEGDHKEIIRILELEEAAAASAEFLEGEHEEIRKEIETEDNDTTLGAEFLTGIHEVPFGDNPTADSTSLKIDNSTFKTDNGGATFDDTTEAPSLDSTNYSWDHEL